MCATHAGGEELCGGRCCGGRCCGGEEAGAAPAVAVFGSNRKQLACFLLAPCFLALMRKSAAPERSAAPHSGAPTHDPSRKRASPAVAAALSVQSSEIVVVSSSSDSVALQPYEADAGFEDVYDADTILSESVRPVQAEHANMEPGLKLGAMCTHYLVKWADYPSSLSSWIPAPMVSRSLVAFYLQQKSRPASAASAASSAVSIAVVAAAAGGANSAINMPTIRPAVDFPKSAEDPVSASKAADAGGAASAPPKKLKRMADDASVLGDVGTLDALKSRVKVLNLDCVIRIRGRDRKAMHDTFRLGCKHVLGRLPCQLQVYCDIKHGANFPTNIRNYSIGTCCTNVCDCCSCALIDSMLVYVGCHRFCQECISVTVMSMVVGQDLPNF